jgi:hypothetical protein
LSITIRAVGHAGRRGATRRVPNAAALLAAVDEWLVETSSDTLRRHRVDSRDPDGVLEVSFHPAARPVRFEATDAGKLIVEAMTVPVGPGYHTYVAGLLKRLGEEVGIAWAPAAAPGGEPIGTTVVDDPEASADPTGFFFSMSRADAERGHLGWLRSSLLAVRDARRLRAEGLHLATPAGVRYTFSGAVATVLGPRDDHWVERALADPRVAADIWPWLPDAMDARYHLNRALTLMWNDVRWRPPVGDVETAALDDVLATLRSAYPLEPALPWPWAEWREAFVLRGQPDPATFQLLQRANTPRGLRSPEPAQAPALIAANAEVAAGLAIEGVAADHGAVASVSAADTPAAAGDTSATAIGYRRGPVTIVHEGWALDLPGSFTDERTVEEWSGSDAGRSVTLAATATGVGDAPMPAETFLRQFAAGLGPDAIEHGAGPVRGRARLSSDASTGVEVATVEGYSAVRGSGAVIRVVIEDPQDWKWALDTWRSLRPA